jgi:DNA polymerase III subunit epsilon
MAREIVLDTETTGIDPRRGHRLIEIGCIEIEDLLPTGRIFHRYVNPEREIEPDAVRIHGITNEMVADKPLFAAICHDLNDFVGDAKIVAHNAAFDRGFVNMELERSSHLIWFEDRWIDSLQMARAKFPGMANSLDALCKRFNISLNERDKHGALIDARLLACVYLELHGGKERALDLELKVKNAGGQGALDDKPYSPRPRALASRLTLDEAQAHQEFIRRNLKDKSLWT